MAGYNEDGTPRLRFDESGNVVGYSGMNNDTPAPTDYTNAIAKQNFGNDMLILGQGWDTPNWADWRYASGGTGERYATKADYWKDVYGGGSVKTTTDPNGGNQVTYFDPEGRTADPSKYISFNGPDSMLGNLVLAGILAGGAAGLTGMLPGTESIFGGAGGAGGAEAAWGVNPASSISTDFGLSGGTAGSASGGLYSGAGGVTGLTPGAGGVGLVAPAASTTTALLTPATAAAAGIPLASSAAGALGAGAAVSPATAMGGAATGGGAATAAGGSALGRIIDGSATAADYAQVLGGAAAAGLGAAGSVAQGDAYSQVADKYLNLGQPYRDLLLQSYQPGFNLASADPAFQGALDTSAQTAARSWSARAGNPADNPGVQSEIQKYVLNSSYLPQLNTYRSQLGSSGGLGVNTAGTGDMNAAGQTSGIFNSLGYGLGQITQPDNPLKGILSQMGNQFKLNTGFSL